MQQTKATKINQSSALYLIP